MHVILKTIVLIYFFLLFWILFNSSCWIIHNYLLSMSEVKSRGENIEKQDDEQILDEQPVIEKDSSGNSKILHLGMGNLLVSHLTR